MNWTFVLALFIATPAFGQFGMAFREQRKKTTVNVVYQTAGTSTITIPKNIVRDQTTPDPVTGLPSGKITFLGVGAGGGGGTGGHGATGGKGQTGGTGGNGGSSFITVNPKFYSPVTYLDGGISACGGGGGGGSGGYAGFYGWAGWAGSPGDTGGITSFSSEYATPSESLTVIVGSGGAPSTKGDDTLLRRGSTVLHTVTGGAAGGVGYSPPAMSARTGTGNSGGTGGSGTWEYRTTECSGAGNTCSSCGMAAFGGAGGWGNYTYGGQAGGGGGASMSWDYFLVAGKAPDVAPYCDYTRGAVGGAGGYSYTTGLYSGGGAAFAQDDRSGKITRISATGGAPGNNNALLYWAGHSSRHGTVVGTTGGTGIGGGLVNYEEWSYSNGVDICWGGWGGGGGAGQPAIAGESQTSYSTPYVGNNVDGAYYGTGGSGGPGGAGGASGKGGTGGPGGGGGILTTPVPGGTYTYQPAGNPGTAGSAGDNGVAGSNGVAGLAGSSGYAKVTYEVWE